MTDNELLSNEFQGSEQKLREKLKLALSAVMNANLKLKIVLKHTDGTTRDELIKISGRLGDLAIDTWNTFQGGESVPKADLRYGKTIRF